MNRTLLRLAGAGFCGAFLLSLESARAAFPDQPPGALNYDTRCAVVESNSVDGFVSNHSWDTYRVNGELNFVFAAPNSISRPEILVRGDSVIPPGETARVSRARLTRNLQPGETCRFDVTGAIRRI